MSVIFFKSHAESEIAAKGREERTEESNALTSIQQSVIVGESDDHDGSDDDLAIDDDGSFFDGVHAQHSGLRHVDDRCSIERAEDATVRAKKERRGSASRQRQNIQAVKKKTKNDALREHKGGGQNTHMVKVPPVISSNDNLPSLAFFPSAAISFSICTIPIPSTFLTTGVTNPFSVATATLKST